MPESQVQRFDEWTMPPSGRTESPVEQIVWQFLSARENAIGLWEDAQLSANGVWVKNHPDEPLAFVGDEVYSVVSRQNLTKEILDEAMGSMVAWWGAPAVLATPPTEVLSPLLEPRPSLTSAHFAPLLNCLQMLFFLAYDGLEYICWIPDSLENER